MSGLLIPFNFQTVGMLAFFYFLNALTGVSSSGLMKDILSLTGKFVPDQFVALLSPFHTLKSIGHT
ncbi:hypothetical protein BIY28_00505 [Brenneria goodwinii]|nr:hypothetical protein BIY28_00505 [Brenneria goodwinii]